MQVLETAIETGPLRMMVATDNGGSTLLQVQWPASQSRLFFGLGR